MDDIKEFEWLPETNELIVEATQALFQNGGTAEKGICIITPHGNIALTKSELERILKEINL